MRTVSPGLVLSTGLAAVLVAASAPAGLNERAVPASSWIVWAAVTAAAIAVLRAKRGGLMIAARQLLLLVPTVVMLTLPAVLFAASSGGAIVGAALVARAVATAAAGLATVSYLGPVGVVAGLRALRLPERFVDVVHGTLSGLSAIVRQVTAMLRARTARGTGHAPWPKLASAPVETLRGFGKTTAALLLRSLERAESLERARRARGAG